MIENNFQMKDAQYSLTLKHSCIEMDTVSNKDVVLDMDRGDFQDLLIQMWLHMTIIEKCIYSIVCIFKGKEHNIKNNYLFILIYILVFIF